MTLKSNSTANLVHIAVITWLTLLSITMLLPKPPSTSIDQDDVGAQLADLQHRTLALEAFRAARDAAPRALIESDIQQALAQWQQQWDALSLRQQDLATVSALADVQNRLDALTLQLSIVQAVPNKPRPSRTTRTKSAMPPFQALGLELRGAERFLTIRPNGADELNAIRLLRVGEAENGWQLEALEPQSALFRFEQNTRRLALPQE